MQIKLAITIKFLFVVILLCPAASVFGVTADNLIWFDIPATHFTQSLPSGNGRLGAMVFGAPNEERITCKG